MSDECDKSSDCADLDNSECGDTDGDNKVDTCICKKDYDYNRYTDRCEKPGDYKDPCSAKKDCKSPLNCRQNKCECPRGYRYSSKAKSCRKGEDLFFIKSVPVSNLMKLPKIELWNEAIPLYNKIKQPKQLEILKEMMIYTESFFILKS